MDDSTLVIVGIIVGVSLLYLGSRIRSRSRRRPPPSKSGGAGSGA